MTPTSPWNRRWTRGALLAAVLALGGLAAGPVAGRSTPELARLQVEGLGLLRNHSLRQSLILLLGKQRGPTIDANGIEDAAIILQSTLVEDGYLEPVITIGVRTGSGPVTDYLFDPQLDHPLPRSIAATDVRYEVQRGPRFKVAAVTFTGLTALPADKARAYFRGDGLLANWTAERAYSPDRLGRSVRNLTETLRLRGYAEASVAAGEPQVNAATGAVAIAITVREGPLWRVTALRYQVPDPALAPAALTTTGIGEPWSSEWEHDAEAVIRRWYFQRGYPDVRIRIVPDAAPAAAGERAVTAVARVNPGPLVRLGAVRFVGNTRTKEAVLRPLVRAKAGDLLDPTQVQDGQYRISRLGVFRAVDLQYAPPSGGTRDAVYELQEGKKQDVDLLAGWGSFEELRAGVEWHDYDLFGLAHEGSLKFVESLKSTEGDYDYTVPELFGTASDGTAKLFGFQLRQRDLENEQYGITLSVATPLPQWGANLLTGYTFERLRAENDTLATALTDLTHATATSVQAGITRDRRDNPLRPRRGYKLFFQAEEASRWLGGQVDFQEVQLSGSYHTNWGPSRWLHLGFSHAFITTLGAPADNVLPPNVLFFPGGEDSIRGYAQGEAAPRDPVTGQLLGAKTITLFSAELEQELTAKWSAVVFSDTLGAAARFRNYPFDYELYSVGVGLRYETIVGPVRLEYGRNLNPRPGDPSGAIQFSVGFPF
jgi:outer membrane protein insertion porin family